jgi:hypothetical protein
MASGMSTYLKHALLNHTFRTTKYTAPSIIYAALFTDTPDADNANKTEVSTSGTGYARVSVSVADSSFDAPSAGATQNTAAITFGTPTGSWGTVNGMGFYDASSGGNLLWFGDLTTPKAVTTGDGAPSFVNGDLDIAF